VLSCAALCCKASYCTVLYCCVLLCFQENMETVLEQKNYEIALLSIRLQESRGRVKVLDREVIEAEQRNVSLQAIIEKVERERERAERERERAGEGCGEDGGGGGEGPGARRPAGSF